MNAHIKDLLAFLDGSPCNFLACSEAIKRLEEAGFSPLNEDQPWQIKTNGRYYVQRDNAAVIAFVIGSKAIENTGFKLAAAHLDSPALKLKPESIRSDKGVCRIGVEVYGGPIVQTWLDKELGIAGKVTYKTGKGKNIQVISSTVMIKKPVAIIPNAAIHLNRDINKGFEYNKQNHLIALLGTDIKDENCLKDLIAGELAITPDRILGMDLFLYDYVPSVLTGVNEDFVVSGRLDDLAMAHTILRSIISVPKPEATTVAVLYDAEEIGSETLQGANGSFLSDTLNRIFAALAVSEENRYIALKRSFLISADMAHAYHPAYPEKFEPSYTPLMNKGPVIKSNANQRYATTSESSVIFETLCQSASVEYQKFLTRSDLPCGSTIGPIASSRLGIRTVDVGNPMWAMHSIRETAGVLDHLSMIKVLSQYYNSI